MAAALYLVSKSGAGQPDNKSINEIHAVIVNADDAGSAAVTIAEAEVTVKALGHPVPDGYFDTVELLGTPVGGIMTTDTDAILLLRRGTDRSIA